jgi:hypothetical protein
MSRPDGVHLITYKCTLVGSRNLGSSLSNIVAAVRPQYIDFLDFLEGIPYTEPGLISASAQPPTVVRRIRRLKPLDSIIACDSFIRKWTIRDAQKNMPVLVLRRITARTSTAGYRSGEPVNKRYVNSLGNQWRDLSRDVQKLIQGQTQRG